MDAREKREKSSSLVEEHGTGAKHQNLLTESDSDRIYHPPLTPDLEVRDDWSPGRQVNLHPT